MLMGTRFGPDDLPGLSDPWEFAPNGQIAGRTS
jgi:hypothetical protein